MVLSAPSMGGFGLNVQAICDSKLRFIYVAVAAPGRTNDGRAYKRLPRLTNWLSSLLNDFIILGNNAYTLPPNLLTPFSGADLNNKDNRTFNFYLSQQQI